MSQFFTPRLDIRLLAELQQPAAFCLSAKDGREIVRITAEGRVVVNPEFTTDEAARTFWRAVQDLAGLFREGKL